MKFSKLALGAATSCLALMAASGAYAQETTAAIRGEVVAGTAPAPNATVTVVHKPSGTRTVTVTNEAGVFEARGLRVGGPYTITVTSNGVSADPVEGVFTQVGETTRLVVQASGPQEVEAVEVIATRDPTADNTGVTSVLDRDDIESVVSVSRDIRDLARRNALVSQNTRGDGGISIAGSNPRTNRVAIDGVQAQDDFGLNTGGLPTRRGPVSLEAVEQFVVDAVPVDVENGDFQGGALDMVLRSGNNRFQGTAFVNYLNEGLAGDSVRGRDVKQFVTQTNYGGFLSGPILRDRLFFAASYELYESATLTGAGPVGEGFANNITGVDQALIDRVKTIFDTAYATDFDPGDVLRSTPLKDEKYTVKLDWNITDNHRLSFTNRYALSELYSRTGLSTNAAGLSSQWYLTGEEDYAYALELNSRWSENLTTQLRITHRDYERRQQATGGNEFAELEVCLNEASINSGTNTLTSCGPTSIIQFGPDEFRQANFLETRNTQLQFKAEYRLANHLLKAGYQGQRIDVFNIFVPASDGVYYFDSIADFQAGRASRLRYSNAVSGVAEDAAAEFAYDLHTLFAQDTAELTDTLTVSGGLRYDWYVMDDRPALNPNFVARRGFSNLKTYDGEGVLMPRVSFDWSARPWLKVRGGLGLFSGGLPDVFLSNVFSNTGILTTGVDIQRTATGFTEINGVPGFTPAIGGAALNINTADPRFGYDIPAAVAALQGNAVPPAANETNAFVPGFKIPSEWKLFLSAAIDAPQGWSAFAPAWAQPALEGWRVDLNLVATEVQEGLAYSDFRANRLVVNGQAQLTPDGRIRYDGISGTRATSIQSVNPGALRDIVGYNDDRGRSRTFSVGLSRNFGDSLGVSLSYAAQQSDKLLSGARFGFQNSELYGNGPAGLDPNLEAYGTDFDEVRHNWKGSVDYKKNFFGDFETRISLFGEVRSGRPTSFTMNDVASGRSPVFGVNRGNHLLYVPDFRSDPNPNDLTVGFVTFDSQATLNNFKRVVDLFGLPQGQIVPKNFGHDNPEIYQVDLHLTQDFPGLLPWHRTQLVFDIQNVLNLVNSSWGLAEEYSDVNRVISVQCANAQGQTAAAGDPTCSGYRYSNYNTSSTVKTIDTNNRSFWAVQIGLRYKF